MEKFEDGFWRRQGSSTETEDGSSLRGCPPRHRGDTCLVVLLVMESVATCTCDIMSANAMKPVRRCSLTEFLRLGSSSERRPNWLMCLAQHPRAATATRPSSSPRDIHEHARHWRERVPHQVGAFLRTGPVRTSSSWRVSLSDLFEAQKVLSYYFRTKSLKKHSSRNDSLMSGVVGSDLIILPFELLLWPGSCGQLLLLGKPCCSPVLGITIHELGLRDQVEHDKCTIEG